MLKDSTVMTTQGLDFMWALMRLSIASHTREDYSQDWACFKEDLLNFASRSADNFDFVDNLRYDQETEEEANSEYLATNFRTQNSRVDYTDLFYTLEEDAWENSYIPESIQKQYPDVAPEEWGTAMRLSALIFAAIQNWATSCKETEQTMV